MIEPLPDAETTAYMDDHGLWVEVGFVDPDDGQRHALRMVAMAPMIVWPLDAVRGAVAHAEEILTQGLVVKREARQRRAAE